MTRDPVFERDGGRCALQIAGVCLGRAGNADHRVNRSQGGHGRPSNKIAECGSGTTGCHGWKTHHPAEAGDLGWYLPAGADTLAEPCFLRHAVYGPGWFLLDDAGGFAAWALPSREAALAAVACRGGS